MEKNIKLLVIDNNLKLIQKMREHFKKISNIKISLEAHDGVEAISMIKKQNQYDLIILDLIIPKKDGLCVLEEIRGNNIDKKIIVETSCNSQTTIRKSDEMGVDYYILKPFDMESMTKRILSLFKKTKENKIIDFHYNDLKLKVTKILHELGFASHLKGFEYIREGILIVYENPCIKRGIIKDLYIKIAKKYDTTYSRVERSIRHAIETSWNRGNWDLMEEIFGHSIDINRAKPTNLELIITIADKLGLENYKNENLR